GEIDTGLIESSSRTLSLNHSLRSRLFTAGGIATPSDAAMMMQLGAEGVFVGSGIFKSEEPLKMAKAIVAATTYFDKPEVLAEVSAGLGKAMHGLEIPAIPKEELLAARGW
ncbi:MAG TPA: hypothetical protein VFD88_02080, partial [Clostridia bacterium]|nr:hypothetical protein [Clostridia bacterium]